MPGPYSGRGSERRRFFDQQSVLEMYSSSWLGSKDSQRQKVRRRNKKGRDSGSEEFGVVASTRPKMSILTPGSHPFSHREESLGVVVYQFGSKGVCPSRQPFGRLVRLCPGGRVPETFLPSFLYPCGLSVEHLPEKSPSVVTRESRGEGSDTAKTSTAALHGSGREVSYGTRESKGREGKKDRTSPTSSLEVNRRTTTRTDNYLCNRTEGHIVFYPDT